jgi:hypothetical protein
MQVSCHLQVGTGLALSLESKPPTRDQAMVRRLPTYQPGLALVFLDLFFSVAVAHHLGFISLARGNLAPKWRRKLMMMARLPTRWICRLRRPGGLGI